MRREALQEMTMETRARRGAPSADFDNWTLSPLTAAVAWGQTRPGVLVAVGLITLWLGSAPLRAGEIQAIGFTEDEYVRIDWRYDLADGWGLITFSPKPRQGRETVATALRQLDLITYGLNYETAAGPIGGLLETTLDLGDLQLGGAYHHAITSAVPLPTFLVTTFPKQGVELTESTLDYLADGAPANSALIPSTILTNALDFVTIRQIPEPGALSLGGALAVMGLGRRRRGE